MLSMGYLPRGDYLQLTEANSVCVCMLAVCDGDIETETEKSLHPECLQRAGMKPEYFI